MNRWIALVRRFPIVYAWLGYIIWAVMYLFARDNLSDNLDYVFWGLLLALIIISVSRVVIWVRRVSALLDLHDSWGPSGPTH